MTMLQLCWEKGGMYERPPVVYRVQYFLSFFSEHPVEHHDYVTEPQLDWVVLRMWRVKGGEYGCPPVVSAPVSIHKHSSGSVTINNIVDGDKNI